MKNKDLVIGKTYLISHSDWSGKATLTRFNPPEFPEGTLQFLCSDGQMGFFCPEDVIMEVSFLAMFTDDELLQELKERGIQMEETRQ
jgi:hypothetical protein